MMKAILAGAPAVLSAALALSCASAEPPSPYKPVASVMELMEGTVQPAAEVFWGSVSTTISAAGIDEKFPKTDEEWEAVWGGAMTIAESGNLLMMPSRVREDAEWTRLSTALVDIGVEAAKAARSRTPETVLEVGEKVYNVCTECHMKFIPAE
jgi:hypothetical protein